MLQPAFKLTLVQTNFPNRIMNRQLATKSANESANKLATGNLIGK